MLNCGLVEVSWANNKFLQLADCSGRHGDCGCVQSAPQGYTQILPSENRAVGFVSAVFRCHIRQGQREAASLLAWGKDYLTCCK